MTNTISKFSLALALALSTATAGSVFAQSSDGAAPASAMEVCMLQWELSDADGDGMVSKDEAVGGFDGQFATIDEDGDGVISAEEFEKCRTG